MPTARSRSSPPPQDRIVPQEEEELRLPRPPGFIRRYWARHPLFADILIATIALLLSLVPATTYRESNTGGGFSDTAFVAVGSGLLPVLIVTACVLLCWRRRFPVVVFLAATVATIGYLSVPSPVGGPLLLLACYALAVYRSSRACWTGLALAIGGLSIIAIAVAASGTIGWQISWNAILSQFVLGLIGALIGVNVGNRKRYVEAVIDRSRQLLVERDQQARIATDAERNRIAREMHDIVSHSLTVVVALSEGAAATPDRERARDASTAAATTARAALAEMRSMLGVLRDGDADAPLAPAEPRSPADTVTAARRAGFPVALTIAGSADLAPITSYAIGRIVQEGVTNAMRHAPDAASISVRIDYGAEPLVVEIVNDGASAPRGAGGFGLRGLEERAARAGGTIHSGMAGDGRWVLRAELPRLPLAEGAEAHG